MAKKFVPLVKRNSSYKLYVTDIKKVHRMVRKATPAIPKYSEEEPSFDAKSETHEITVDFEFEPLEIWIGKVVFIRKHSSDMIFQIHFYLFQTIGDLLTSSNSWKSKI